MIRGKQLARDEYGVSAVCLGVSQLVNLRSRDSTDGGCDMRWQTLLFSWVAGEALDQGKKIDTKTQDLPPYGPAALCRCVTSQGGPNLRGRWPRSLASASTKQGKAVACFGLLYAGVAGSC